LVAGATPAAESVPRGTDRRPTSRFTVDTMLQRNLPGPAAEQDRVALVYGSERLTFGDLERRSSGLARGLLGRGFRHGDAVCVLAHNRTEWFELLFALAKIGGVIVPVNYLLKPKEVAYIVADSGARWVVGDDALWPTVEALVAEVETPLELVSLDSDRAGAASYAELVATEGETPFPPVDAEDLLLLQYTSGTTGFPKGAMHTHATVLWNSLHQVPDFGITRDDVHLVIPAMCWAAGFHSFTLAVMWAGGRVVIHPSRGFSPEEFCATVEEQGVTKTILVPAVLRRVLGYDRLEQHDLSSLNLALSGGEPVPVQLIDEWHRRVSSCALVQGYGMGEFPTLMLYLDAEDAVRKAGAAGKACLAAQVRVVDTEFCDVAVDEVGEIVVLSPACTVGYYRKPEATAETYHDGWMRTGDLARVDDEGYVYVAGRAKEMVIVGGLNVYPAEIERVLLDLDQVAEVAVVGVPDPRWGEVPEAVVVLKPGQQISVEVLEDHCRSELANYKIPRRWTIRAEPLPRTTSGKIQRGRIADQARDALQSGLQTSPQTTRNG
jgi:fatty-acyl-CoA synthase